jgi:deoxyribonuclease V
MEPVASDLRPEPSLSRDSQIELQRDVARRAVFEDAHGLQLDDPTEMAVLGVDSAFAEDEVVSAAVVVCDGEVLERQFARAPLRMPYIPGLLCFREGEAVMAAMSKLQQTPDLLVCDGSGRIHLRQAGLATHLGVLFDIPSVGVAKNLLCGQPTESLSDPLPEGTRVSIEADERVEAVSDEDADWPTIGYAYQTRQFENTDNRHVNPVYVSPGHRLRAATAVKCAASTRSKYKLPRPVREADRAADAARGKD